MIKTIYGKTQKEQLIASANDRLYRFLISKGNIRGVILNATKMINEMRESHELGVIETLILGHAYIAGALLSANLKGHDRIGIQIECSGPVKGLNVEANAFNEVRGYLKNVPVQINTTLEKFDISSLYGAGFLTITKYLEDSKSPFKGTVALMYGNLANDLSYYFVTSEQIPTSFSLSIHFDQDGIVSGAGGMFLQAMPGADDKDILAIEKTVNSFPSIGLSMANKEKPSDLVKKSFSAYSPEILSDTRLEFLCHCKKNKMAEYLNALPTNEIEEILAEEKFPVEIRCHNCNTKYYFNENEILELSEKKSIQ